ncbi:MAG TPA: 23S rRNA (adenine(1618)-N(6))-methyltransferase RlmF [Holophagaceae bacterium]|nr:23S rRNA (adenine(1618)-N(6))-methyltransferase RlmF [Holophagaceae bacterium]
MPTKLPVPAFHPRNRHQGRYDFPALVKACPELKGFVRSNPSGGPTVDFADPRAVKALNRALLALHYGIAHWDLPEGFLCPPVPGRADHLHHLADLLAADAGGAIPRGLAVRVLDLGVGANAIHPLIGHKAYGWRFLGSDIDRAALASAQRLVDANGLGEAIELRRQSDPLKIFEGLLKPGERFDLSMCNPPFHASAAEAREGSARKWRNLGRDRGAKAPIRNFGGQGAELWCPGGEEGFILRMIAESAAQPERCRWFTTLVSRSATLPSLRAALRKAGAKEVRTLDMAQGQKKSRILAWTFLDEAARAAWAAGS